MYLLACFLFLKAKRYTGRLGIKARSSCVRACTLPIQGRRCPPQPWTGQWPCRTTPHSNRPDFNKDTCKSKEPQHLFLTDFKMASSGLSVSSLWPCCPRPVFRRQAGRSCRKTSLCGSGVGVEWQRLPEWAQLLCLISRRPVVSDQRARAPAESNFQK